MVKDYLLENGHVGLSNAVKQSRIIHDTGLDRREVRKQIESVNADIKTTYMISFNNDGVFIVDSIEEIKTARKRAVRAILRNVQRIKKCDMILNDKTQLDFEDLWDEDEKERGLL